MHLDPRFQGRRSMRLKGYDYSQAGAYFLTMCAARFQPVFGEVVQGEVVLSIQGRIARICWLWLGYRYSSLELDQWVLMPNHLHGIVRLIECRGGSQTAPTGFEAKPLGGFIGAFKTVSTKWSNDYFGTPGEPLWQRNYYDRIIRDRDELERIRRYILENPQRWELDRYSPLNTR